MESGSPDPEITAEEYVAIVSYQAEGPGQVSFEEGDRIHVLDKLEDGRWTKSSYKTEVLRCVTVVPGS